VALIGFQMVLKIAFPHGRAPGSTDQPHAMGDAGLTLPGGHETCLGANVDGHFHDIGFRSRGYNCTLFLGHTADNVTFIGLVNWALGIEV
jgi:hypothetical protein